MANSDCKEILNLIPLYMDNMLSEEETDIVSRHLETCKTCAEHLRFITSISKSSATLSDVDMPLDFSKKIIEKAKELQNKKRAKRIVILRRASAGIATAAVIALCVVNIPKTADINKKQTPENDATPTTDIAQIPVSISAPVTENTAQEPTPTANATEESTPKTAKAPQEADKSGGGSSAVPHADSVSHAPAMLCDEDSFIVATVTIPEDISAQALEILSSCPQDEKGYKAENISTILQKLTELGATIETRNDTSITDNYIIIK